MDSFHPDTWNGFDATIETNRYSSLPAGALNDVNVLMEGDEENRWDCWINHYRAYSWSELDDGVRKSYETLGWDGTFTNRGN